MGDNLETGLLKDITVLDLADEKAAFCGKLLADLGAHVIKIEPPGGDISRLKPPMAEVDGSLHSLWFAYHNAGKPCMTMALDHPDGVRAFRQLVKSADIVIETFAPDDLERLGLGYDALQSLNPGVIMVSVTGFGQTGPNRQWQSCDLVAAATGGQAFITGGLRQAPKAPFGEQVYYTASLYAAVGIGLALQARALSGVGRHIDVSLQEAALGAMDHVMLRYFQDGIVAERQGGRHWDRLFAILPCRNGLIHMTPLLHWDTLVGWLDGEGMAADLTDARWSDASYRSDHADHILDILSVWTKAHTVEDLFETSQLMGLPWAPVTAPAEVSASPQLAERQFWQSGDIMESGAARAFPGMPYKFDPSWNDDRQCPSHPDAQNQSEVAPIADFGEPLPKDPAGKGVSDLPALPLQGIRVLDFTRVLAGPFATRLLADFGAQVIKVQTRQTAVGAEDNSSAFFAAWNRNKLGITLDMRRPEAKSLALELAAVSDVIIENFSPRVLDNWDLTYHRFKAVKPDIILTRMSAMGQTGPWRDCTAFAPTIHSLSGHTWLNQDDQNRPGGLGFAHADITAGLYCATAVLAALEARRRTGCGRLIDLSQYEAALTTLGPVLAAAGDRPGTASSMTLYADLLAAPYGCYPCRGLDRWCAIAVMTDAQWQRLVKVLEQPAWAADGERFATMENRKNNAAVLDRYLIEWTRSQEAEALAHKLQQVGIPAGAVQSAADIAKDSHLMSRHVFSSVIHPYLGRPIAERPPIRFMDQPQGPLRPAPMLGQHNEFVFRTLLGLSDKTYTEYLDKGVIG